MIHFYNGVTHITMYKMQIPTFMIVPIYKIMLIQKPTGFLLDKSTIFKYV